MLENFSRYMDTTTNFCEITFVLLSIWSIYIAFVENLKLLPISSVLLQESIASNATPCELSFLIFDAFTLQNPH